MWPSRYDHQPSATGLRGGSIRSRIESDRVVRSGDSSGAGCAPADPAVLRVLLVESSRSQPVASALGCGGWGTDCGQASRVISTAQLHMSPCFHLPPINVLVSYDPSGCLRIGNAHLGGGFPLRCFQRLSLPNVATRPCHWRDNRYTSGWSIPVLSY